MSKLIFGIGDFVASIKETQRLAAQIAIEIKGEAEGHPFRGNQWTEGGGSGDPLGDWGSPVGAPDNVYYGYRGENKTGIGFGSSEGEGMYLAKDEDTAGFFSETGKVNRLKFEKPSNPIVVDNEPLHILKESDILTQPISKSDSAWTKYNKQAYQAAKKKGKWEGDQWDADKVSHELTSVLKKNGHDGVIVNSGGESWVVLFNPKIIK